MNLGTRFGSPFRRANIMIAALAAAAAGAGGSVIVDATAGMAVQSQLASLGPYRGRGKHKTRVHNRGGTKAQQRAALKQRNRARHRKACRG